MEQNKENIQDLFDDAERCMLRLLPPEQFGEHEDADVLHQCLTALKKIADTAPELLEALQQLASAGREALDYKDGSGRQILQEAIWKAEALFAKVTGEKEDEHDRMERDMYSAAEDKADQEAEEVEQWENRGRRRDDRT